MRISSHARAALPIINEGDRTNAGHVYLLVLQSAQSHATIDRTRESMDISIAAYCDTWATHTSTSGRGPTAARSAIPNMLNEGRNHVIRPRRRFAMPPPQYRDAILIPSGGTPPNSTTFDQRCPVGLYSTAAHLEEVMVPNPDGRNQRQKIRWWANRLGCASSAVMNPTTPQPTARQRLREVAKRRISLVLSLAETYRANT